MEDFNEYPDHLNKVLSRALCAKTLLLISYIYGRQEYFPYNYFGRPHTELGLPACGDIYHVLYINQTITEILRAL